MIAVLLITLLLIVIYWIVWQPLNYWKRRGFPYLRPWPFVGNFPASMFQMKSFIEEAQELYNRAENNKLCGIFVFGKPALMIKDPNILKAVTIKEFDHFTDRSTLLFDTNADPFFGKALFLLRGQTWKKMRNTMSSAFTSKKMKDMFEIISECGDYMAQYFLKKARNHADCPVHAEMKSVFSRYTNDVISTTAFGIKCDSFENEHNDFFTYGRKMMNLNIFRMILLSKLPSVAKFFDIGYMPNDVYKFFRSTIKDTLATRKANNIYRPDLLQLLMEAQKGTLENDEENMSENMESNTETILEKAALTDEDIAAQSMVFYFGGFETTSGLLSFASYELSIHPGIQKKVRDEIISKFERSGGRITYQDVQECVYLDMVIAETLRKWPPGGILDRVCIKTCTIKNEDGSEITIPEGTILMFPMIGFQRDSQYFPNPDKFDPERFSDQNKHNINQFAYMPFGVGPRLCLGSRLALLEMKVALIHLLVHFDFIVTEDTQIPLKVTRKSLLMVSERGIHIGLKLRK